jgi:hypothetical protein
MGTNLAAALAGHTSQTQNRLNYADPYFYDLVDNITPQRMKKGAGKC